MQVSVIVCTHNRASSLRKTLESLGQMSVAPDLTWELLVVDNNSTDSTQQEIDAFSERSGLNVRYVWEPQTGKSFALNTGIAQAKGEIVAFTDDDVLVAPEWLTELTETFKQFECIGVGGKCIALWNGLARPNWFTTEGPYRLYSSIIPFLDLGDEVKETAHAPFGANMAFKKSAFEQYGLFRTDLGPSGAQRVLGDDVEFGRRVMRAGRKVVYSPKVVVFHPVLPNRITKDYCLSYYLNGGRAQIREAGWPCQAVLWFGVPRYLFRTLLTRCLIWLITLESAKRFYYKAQVYLALGQLTESWMLRRKAHRYGISTGQLVKRIGGTAEGKSKSCS